LNFFDIGRVVFPVQRPRKPNGQVRDGFRQLFPEANARHAELKVSYVLRMVRVDPSKGAVRGAIGRGAFIYDRNLTT